MIKFFKQPHLLYGMVVLLYLILALQFDLIIDIAIHDRYIILSTAQIYLFVSLLTGLYCVVAYFFKRKFSPLNLFLTYLHLILNLIGYVAISILSVYKSKLKPAIYQDFNIYQPIGTQDLKTSYTYNEWLSIVLISLVIIQSIFVLNITSTLIRAKN